jgi:hypothetical protein
LWGANRSYELVGLGGGFPPFHNPQQFATWRRAWEVVGEDGGGVGLDWSDLAERAAEQGIDDGWMKRVKHRELLPRPHTGLPLKDRCAVLALLNTSDPRLSHLCLAGPEPPMHITEDLVITPPKPPPCPTRNPPPTVKGPRANPPAVRDLRLVWRLGSNVLLAWRWVRGAASPGLEVHGGGGDSDGMEGGDSGRERRRGEMEKGGGDGGEGMEEEKGEEEMGEEERGVEGGNGGGGGFRVDAVQIRGGDGGDEEWEVFPSSTSSLWLLGLKSGAHNLSIR